MSQLGTVERGRSRHRPRHAPELYEGQYPFIQTGDIKSSGGRITSHSQTYSEAGLAQSRLWPVNTLAITIAANIAETAILTYPACFPDSVVGFVADESKCDVRFVEYLFRHLRSQIQHEHVGTGSVQDNINLRTLDELRFLVPPLAEQQAIAHVLGTLDDKIELNRRMNRTLGEMARAIFQDWFVDFGPTRAKMEGQEPYLPPELWDLFPDELLDSELGEIPEGWEWKTLKTCFHLTMGQSPPGRTYNDHGEGLPFFQGSTDFGPRFPTNRRFCSAPTRIAQRDDTLVSVRAPIGDINMAWEKCCIGRGVAALRHTSGAQSFSYHSALLMKPEFQVYEQMGTVFGAITKIQFESLPVLDPDPRVLELFEAIVRPLDQQNRSGTGAISGLTEQRDTLLPKLISGTLSPRVQESDFSYG